LPPPDLFPDNVERALSEVEVAIGPGAVSRLRMFLGKCMEAGIKPSTSPKQWIPFKRYGLIQFDHWDEPKPHSLAMFYLLVERQTYGLQFPVAYYYANVVGYDVDRLTGELTDLGFRPVGKDREPRIDLRIRNDQTLFNALFELVVRTAGELEETLQET
ncbi:MAG: hypothetical protein ACE5LU_12620, partial [Anaerolineae bacterium]